MTAAPPARRLRAPRQRQRGFTLVELLIALLIGLFLLGGLLTLVQTNRRVFTEQAAMTQLQDNQRLALTMITDVVQQAGYFPNPLVNTAASSLPVTGSFTTAGQAIFGTHAAAAPGDTLTVRYMTASGDGILNCAGLSNATGANAVYVATYKVASGNLVCTLNGTDYVLVSGVTNFQVLYGVKTNFANNNNGVDTYLNATQMAVTPSNWVNVYAVKVTLTFTNPLYKPGTPQPATLSVPTVIAVMSGLGVLF